ncbi:carbohydrate ABC transporter permease, partial [bacterium]|nr:carbohydrate ABC transporter permease [bacterium]
MPIILETERRSLKTRLIFAAMYLVLGAGACTMVYPFLLMLSGSVKSRVDAADFDVVPRYLHDADALFRKQQESKYNEDLQLYLTTTGDDARNFRTIEPPPPCRPALVADWRAFLAEEDLPASWFQTGNGPTLEGRVIQENERAFRNFVRDQCGGAVAEFQRRFGEPIENWFFLRFAPERLTDRKYQVSDTPLMAAFYVFKATLAPEDRIVVSCDGAFARYAALRGDGAASTLEARGSPGAWENFVRTALHPQFITVAAAARGHWARFLAGKYGAVANLNKLYSSDHVRFEDVPLPEDRVRASAALTDYLLFLSDPASLPLEHMTVDTPEIRWRAFLRRTYSDPAAMAEAHGREYATVDSAPMPQREADRAHCLEHRGALTWRYLTRNFRMVFEYILLYGHGIRNTLLYCALSIALALLVNPMAAYALSRYDLPSQYKVLLFLIATMAFPGVVTMIPNFLLLRDLGLLNTFAVLLLPGMANGYAIFLLKGFFDSLPRPLYEAADIDGATEWHKFWLITMSLSKPILAVIALGAFNAAYGNFMYAFILCQDREMWTLMVWLYQLQQFSSQGVVFASLLVAAVPTLLIFVFCQNII